MLTRVLAAIRRARTPPGVGTPLRSTDRRHPLTAINLRLVWGKRRKIGGTGPVREQPGRARSRSPSRCARTGRPFAATRPTINLRLGEKGDRLLFQSAKRVSWWRSGRLGEKVACPLFETRNEKGKSCGALELIRNGFENWLNKPVPKAAE